MKLSLAIATYNEEKHIADCIASCEDLVDEIIVVDGSSSDKTREIAKSLGAQVITTENRVMFHTNKQKAMDLATGDWILQLDADERVTPDLAQEIKKVMLLSKEELEAYQINLPERKLFIRHQQITNPKLQTLNHSQTFNSQYNAFYIPRLNYFLGKFLRYGGVYPDGVIRLVRKGKAFLPCKDVHELMRVEGTIGWLQNPLLHYDSPTFLRYLERNKRYIKLLTGEIKSNMQSVKIKNNGHKLIVFKEEILLGINWLFVKPIVWFFMTTFRHKGILDGWRGVVFSFFSALRFPRAYICYKLKKI